MRNDLTCCFRRQGKKRASRSRGYRRGTRSMSFEFPFEYADIEGIGPLFYPIIRAQLKTTDGWREFEFLVDTGADITTVPSHILPVLGLKKNQLSANKMLGVGGFSLATWELQTSIRIGNEELSIHCNAVDSRHDSMPLLLGRKDIFEDVFTLIVDSKQKVTVLSKN